jgi:hypothetical protein
MQLVIVTLLLCLQHVSAVHRHHQVSTIAKTAALQGMPQFYIKIKVGLP